MRTAAVFENGDGVRGAPTGRALRQIIKIAPHIGPANSAFVQWDQQFADMTKRGIETINKDLCTRQQCVLGFTHVSFEGTNQVNMGTGRDPLSVKCCRCLVSLRDRALLGSAPLEGIVSHSQWRPWLRCDPRHLRYGRAVVSSWDRAETSWRTAICDHRNRWPIGDDSVGLGGAR